MAFDLEEGLRRSNARFMATMNRIFEEYNHPFEDDIIISLNDFTYDTPKGPRRLDKVSEKMHRKWKDDVFKSQRDRDRQRAAETSKQQTSDSEDDAPTVPASPENSSMYTSDIDDERYDSVVSIRRRCEDTDLQNPYVDDGKIQENVKVQVDVIVQEDAREIPKWITIPPQGSSQGRHLALPVEEPAGTSNKVAACSKRVDLSTECSSSRPPQLQFSGVPISQNKLTLPRHQPFPEPDETSCDSLLENDQSAHEEGSCGDATLADLYPAMVEVLKRFMTKQSQRKASTFGYLRHKGCCSRRPKLSVTVDKIRGFRPPKLKRALPSMCSSRSEDIQNQTFGNENRELCVAGCSSNNLSGLVPSSYIDTNEIKVGYSDLSSEHPFVSGKGQEVSIFPTDMVGMRERFLVEDKLQATVSLRNFKRKEYEKLAYKRSFQHRFITLADSSESKVLNLVNESKTQKTGFSCGETSESWSSPCSSYGNRNTSETITNSSPARPSNTLLINPEKIISERLVSFQRRHSSSSLSVKQSPSYMPQSYDDAFEKLYQLCTKEIQKPFVLTRPLPKFQNLEVERRLVKNNSSDSSRSDIDREFDRIYEELCGEAVPKLPAFQRASNSRQYKIVKISEISNALVNSPVLSLTAIPRVKRLGNFQNDHLCSPVKRLKHMPARYSPSTKFQQVSHREIVNLQTLGMDFLRTDNGSNPSFFDSHNCQSQDSGFCAPSDRTIAVPGTFLQGSGIEGTHSGWLKTMKNYSSPREAQKCHRRVSRKLSYTDGKD